jgi:hypothetical protein
MLNINFGHLEQFLVFLMIIYIFYIVTRKYKEKSRIVINEKNQGLSVSIPKKIWTFWEDERIPITVSQTVYAIVEGKKSIL